MSACGSVCQAVSTGCCRPFAQSLLCVLHDCLCSSAIHCCCCCPHRSFTGSAGTALVTLDKALLWTDGRYYLQAESELGADWTLMRGGSGTCPEVGASVSTLGVTRTVYLCHYIGFVYIAYLFDPWYGMRHTWPLGRCGGHMQPGPFSPCLPKT